jgi:hypothetical protein
VPNPDKEDGELGGDGLLWGGGVVVKNGMVFDELHEAVKNSW